MAMVQDELGNWYDDGTGGGYDTSYGSAFGNANYGDQPEYMPSVDDDFSATYPTTGGQYGGMPSVDDDFAPTYPINTAGQYGGLPSVDSDFSPTYPITGGGIGGRTAVGGGSGILDYLKSMDLTSAAGLAGAALGATGALTNKPKKAYEGKIPQLQAVRNMVTAPPTANYRPGQGGVNWNADTYYVPRGSVAAGESANIANATAAANAAKANTAAAAKKNSTLSNIAKTAGLAALAKQVLGGTGNKTTDGIKTLLDKVTGGTTGKTVLDAITGGTKTTAGGTTTGGGGPGGTTKTGGTGTAANTGIAGAITKAITGGTNTAGGTSGGTGTTTKGGTPAGGGGSGAGSAGGAGGTRGIGGTGADGEEGLTTPEGEYAGEDEFAGIDDQVAANENALETPNELTDEEIDEELARVAAETADEYGTGEDDTGDGSDDTAFNWDEDMGSDYDFGSDDTTFNWDEDMGSDYSLDGYDFGDDYSDFDFGGGDDFSFDLGDYDFARGGKINMAKGRYLQGNTDGMADKIPARIGRKQPAALSHGEFVVPADVVSHLGNGNSDAGAKKLYQMMDRIRVARTGNKEQGKQINPDKFMPGGLAQAYANGGKVQGFPDGGAVGATGLGSAVSAGITGTETGPNSWAGDYMSDLLGKTQALTESPYQQYMGPLSAGASDLQNKTFSGLQNTAFPSNLGQSFSSAGAYQAPQMNTNAYQTQPLGMGGNTPTTLQTPAAPGQSQGIASQYMNPYLQGVLDPQMAELRRQNDITNMGSNAKMTQAGAFGGSRQAIMNAENNRNLMQEMNKTVGAGYANAYDKAQQQFNTEQTQGRSLADLMAQQGATQRGIEAEGMAADKASFEGARENPYKMLQFQQSMLNGLPVSATSYNIAQPTKAQEILAGAAGGAKAVGTSNKTVADLLQQLGL